MALDFDGTADLVNVGSNALSDVSTKTLSIWCKADTYGEGGLGAFFKKTQYTFGVSNGCLQFSQLFTSSTNGLWRSAVGSFNTGVFTHVAITYTNSSTANIPTFYINGSAQTTTTVTQPVGFVNGDTSFALILGNGEFAGDTFDGILEEATFHNVILTADEIANLASSRQKYIALNVRPSALLGLWPMDDFPDGANATGTGSIRNRANFNNNGTPSSNPPSRATQILSYR